MTRAADLLAGDALAAALDIRFVREVSDGTITDVAFANYLQIEEAFVRTATRLHGLAVWDAPSWSAVLDNARAIHALVGEQTDYFHAARAAWPAPAAMSERQLARSALLSRFATEAARAGGYAAVVTTLLAAESLYLAWCSRAVEGGRVPAGLISDWVGMHAADPFRAGVDALAAAVDAIPEDVSDARLRAWFCGMIEAEIVFHDSVFDE